MSGTLQNLSRDGVDRKGRWLDPATWGACGGGCRCRGGGRGRGRISFGVVSAVIALSGVTPPRLGLGTLLAEWLRAMGTIDALPFELWTGRSGIRPELRREYGEGLRFCRSGSPDQES